MMQQYLMRFYYEHDYTKTERFKIVTGPVNATWRELQQMHDPNYQYDYLRFNYLGGELEIK